MSIENPEPRASEPKLIEMPDWDKLALPDTPEADKEDTVPFAVGEAVSVPRSHGGVDHIGWIVESADPVSTVVVNPDKGMKKTVNTSELWALQNKLDEQLERDLGYNPKEAAVDMADRAFSVVGPANPAATEPATDEFSSAQSAEFADALAQPQEEVLSAQAELVRFKEELDAFEASLPEEDRVPAWQYSTARFENEKENAIRKMSAATRDNKAYLAYARLYKRYSDARSRAR